MTYLRADARFTAVGHVKVGVCGQAGRLHDVAHRRSNSAPAVLTNDTHKNNEGAPTSKCGLQRPCPLYRAGPANLYLATGELTTLGAKKPQSIQTKLEELKKELKTVEIFFGSLCARFIEEAKHAEQRRRTGKELSSDKVESIKTLHEDICQLETMWLTVNNQKGGYLHIIGSIINLYKGNIESIGIIRSKYDAYRCMVDELPKNLEKRLMETDNYFNDLVKDTKIFGPQH